ncbi:LPS-assembly protein LptD [Comamonas testosteroni]|uniref:LPS-assembly protein LptD n=1 Tax=Comamonas testosteroni TaxID=285 RepID=A0A373FL44_COMTE|nr:LPS-assembly protein LptD [Comamonas testosteroni]RGE44901.1 LPS-assembly protein LptD [Comamonas testosteroni]
MALAWAGAGLHAHAQESAVAADALPALQLKSSPLLQETYPKEVQDQQPTYIKGDSLSGQPDIKASVHGGAEIRRGDTMIRADKLDYAVPEDTVNAVGSVYINQAGNVYQGTALDLQVDAFKGQFDNANYRFLANGAYGDASRVDFVDKDHAVVHNATYTTCQRDDEASWTPSWMLKAESIDLDMAEEVGVAKNAKLQFKGITVLPVPSMSFPLSDKRKSGLLPPMFGMDKLGGIEYSQPYYWNIAPNRDLTVTPTLMTKRGVNLTGLFRYLEPRYSGETYASYMPGDNLRNRDRWGLSWQHRATFDTPVGGLGLNMNLNRVSDDDYWRDFRLAPVALRQRLLPSTANLSWVKGDGVLSLNMTRYQTLQDPSSPIAPPYSMVPQLQYRYTPLDLPHGLDFSFVADTTRFELIHPIAGQVANNGQRSYMQAQLSRPFLSPGAFITPKLMLHSAMYQTDQLMSNGSKSANRTLPTFSLDGGLVFERDTSWFGANLLQTFEPRAFYTYTPYRDQSMLPLYDTSRSDFNFASIFSENDYIGQDRLADNHLLTLGATSRFIDPESGAEKLKLAIAQRVRLSDQRVLLPGEVAATSKLSDILLGGAINWTDKWSLEGTTQYNKDLGRTVRTTATARYSPGNYRTFNIGYRTQLDTQTKKPSSELIDVGWQWPINDLWGDKGKDLGPGRGQGGGRWYAVGRLNYSIKDKKLVDTVVGFEYDGCCWIGRVVLERLQSSVIQSNLRLLFQLEFVGFSRLSFGADPTASLKRNVPRYQYLREAVTPPSRFTNYD